MKATATLNNLMIVAQSQKIANTSNTAREGASRAPSVGRKTTDCRKLGELSSKLLYVQRRRAFLCHISRVREAFLRTGRQFLNVKRRKSHPEAVMVQSVDEADLYFLPETGLHGI